MYIIIFKLNHRTNALFINKITFMKIQKDNWFTIKFQYPESHEPPLTFKDVSDVHLVFSITLVTFLISVCS